MLAYIRNTLGLAIGNLRRNSLRTALSLLGVTIGVFSVTLIVSLGFGLKGYIVAQVEQFGKNFVSINPKVPGLSHQGSATSQMSGGAANSIDYDDMEALAKLQHVEQSIGLAMSQGFLASGNKERLAMVIGTTANYTEFDRQTKIAEGRFFSSREESSLSQVVVIGPSIAKRLFGEESAVGRKVRFKNLNLEVVGVTESRGNVAVFDFDTMAIMPLKLLQKYVNGNDYVQEIDLIVSDKKYIEQVAEEVTRVLRKRHNITDPDKDDFMMHTYTEVMKTIGTVTNAITILLGLLAAVSLLVGGIGIMNIMLVSVTERIQEIGLRKALGAKNSVIWAQFLVEAVILTTMGGGLGGILGTLITVAIIAFARYSGFAIQYVVSLPSFLMALFVAMTVGIIFGSYPAKRAAELDPIAALRWE